MGAPSQIVAELEGPSGKLVLTQDGRRRWVDPSGQIEESGHRFPPGQVGAIQLGGGRLAFVSRLADVRVVEAPLGPATSARSGLAGLGVVATGVGREAIVAATETGQVLRSTDLGRTWTRVQVPVRGVPVGLALDGQGRGLLLTAPQALWWTTDDGLTWERIPTPVGGADWVAARPRGLLVGGARGGRPLHVFDGRDLARVPRADVSSPLPSVVLGQLLTPRGVLQLVRGADADAPPALTWLQPDEPAGARTEALPEPGCSEPRVFGYEDDVWVACATDLGMLRLWHRRGVEPWRPDGEVAGAFRRSPVAGPRGWLLTESHLRPGHGQVPIQLDPDVEWEATLVDGDVVHLLGSRRGEWVYGISTPAVPAPALRVISEEALVSVTLIPRGGRVSVIGYLRDRWVSLDPATAGATPSPVEPFLGLPPGTMRVLLGGVRGVACTTQREVFETADGGASWVAIQGEVLSLPGCPPTHVADRCAPTGCQFEEALRFGWQLAGRRPPAIPVPPEVIPGDLAASPTQGEARLSCETAGDEVSLGAVRETLPLEDSFAIGGGLRWATPALSERGIELATERANGAREQLTLLPGRLSAASRWSWHASVFPEGAFVVRESTSRGTSSVRAELAARWWKGATTSRAEVRVQSHELSPDLFASPAGFAVRPFGEATDAHVLSPEGRLGRLAVPGGTAHTDRLVRLGGESFRISADSDWLAIEGEGRRWDWFLGGRVHHGDWDGRAAVGVDVFTGPGDWAASLPFAVALAGRADPEVLDSVSARELPAILDRPCEPFASGGVVAWARRSATVVVDAGESLPAHALVRMRPRVAPCLIGHATPTFLPRFAFVPADAPDRASLFRFAPAEVGRAAPLSVAPLRCATARGR